MVSKIQSLVASAFFALIAATGANAATMTYTNAEPTPAIQLTIDNAVVTNGYRFSLSTADEFGTADYLALGFNFEGSLSLSNFSVFSATDAVGDPINPFPTLTLYGDGETGINDCEQGCNFKEDGNSTLWDYIIKFAGQGGGGDNYVGSIVFDIVFTAETFALTSFDSFSQFAVRAQSTTNDGGSIKTDLTPEISPVPLPAGLPLLLSGLLAAGLLARRRTV